MKKSARILSALGAAALLAAMSLPASAQTRASFATFDRDGNGVITQQELHRARAQRPGMNRPDFADFDTNRDGSISQDELNQYRSDKLQQRAQEGRLLRNATQSQSFADMDTNKDGKIDATEFSNHQMQHQRGRNR